MARQAYYWIACWLLVVLGCWLVRAALHKTYETDKSLGEIARAVLVGLGGAALLMIGTAGLLLPWAAF